MLPSCYCLFLSILIPLSNPLSYENPVYSSLIDSPLIPTVIHDQESRDFLLTLSNSGVHDFSIQLLHSYSLIDWISLGWAVTGVPGSWNMDSSSLHGARMWRTKYRETSVMILVFSAMHEARRCIGYGFARGEELNSFTIIDIPLHCSEQNSELFPALYQDDKHLYLLWSERNETASYIFICSLKLLRGHLHIDKSSKSLLLESSNATLAAPYLFHFNSYYYLFYTSNIGTGSAIQAARSKLKTGQFVQQSEAIIRSNPSATRDSWHSPSYPSLVHRPNGAFIMLYQGSKLNPGRNDTHTFLLLDQLEYTDAQWFRMAAVCGMSPTDPYPSSCRHSIDP